VARGLGLSRTELDSRRDSIYESKRNYRLLLVIIILSKSKSVAVNSDNIEATLKVSEANTSKVLSLCWPQHFSILSVGYIMHLPVMCSQGQNLKAKASTLTAKASTLKAWTFKAKTKTKARSWGQGRWP